MTARLFAIIVMLAGPAAGHLCAEDKARITVVSVLACCKDKEIDQRLGELADALKKKEPSWRGFKVERVSQDSVKIGAKKSFKLADELEMPVRIKERTETGCMSIVMHPPTMGEVAYTCCCDKFFPVITRHETKDQRRLVIAVMVESCPTKKK